jgi:hypothetical protein
MRGFISRMTHRSLEKAGFSHDSTMGYNETIGFRAAPSGLSPGRRSASRLPMHIMDTLCFSRLSEFAGQTSKSDGQPNGGPGCALWRALTIKLA